MGCICNSILMVILLVVLVHGCTITTNSKGHKGSITLCPLLHFQIKVLKSQKRQKDKNYADLQQRSTK